MQRYSGVRESIKLPESLSNPGFLYNMIQMVKKIIYQVESENHFSETFHSILSHLSDIIQKTSLQSQSKFNSTSGANSLACKEVIKVLYTMFRHLEQQSYKNQITLKTIAKTERDEPLFKSIVDKCDKIKQKTQEYMKVYDHYQSTQLVYIQKTQKFQNLDTNPIKYFSVEVSSDKITKITEMEMQLQRTLERLKLEQGYLQNMYKEMRNFISELLYHKVKRMYEIITLSREVVAKMLTFEEIIIQEGSKDYITNISDDKTLEDYTFTSTQQAVTIANKMLEKQRMVRFLLQQYIINTKASIQNYRKQLLNSEFTNLSITLNKDKKLIQTEIGPYLYYDRIDSAQQINRFCTFLQKLSNKIQITKAIAKYRKSEDILLENLEGQMRSLTKKNQSIKDQEVKLRSYSEMKTYLKKKYTNEADMINSSFKQDIMILIRGMKELRETFLTQFKPYQKPDLAKIQQMIKDILMSEHFKILNQPFLLVPVDYKFTRSPYIQSFIRNRNSDNADISVDLNDTENKSLPKMLFNKTCCGGTSSKDQKVIDQFNCALVNKILLQGKLVLYKKKLKFTSIFNRSTFFGKTKIKIPAKEIVKIDKDDDFINGIMIQTTHGVLRFSSFLTNPIPILKHYYSNGSINFEERGIDNEISNIEGNETEFPKVYASQIPATTLANKIIEQGFVQKDVNEMYRSYMNGNSRVNQVVKFKENGNEAAINVQYAVEGKEKQIYNCEIKRTPDGKINSQYQFSETTKVFQEDFVELMRNIMDDKKMRNRSRLFSISSIHPDTESRGEALFQKNQGNTLGMTPVQTLHVPNDDNSLDLSHESQFINSNIYNSRITRGLNVSTNRVSLPKQEIKQQPNPLVLYIILGMVVFALAIII